MSWDGWYGGTQVWSAGYRVAEIVRHANEDKFYIRNLRPNGTIGVCWHGPLNKVRGFLDTKYPGWKETK